MKINGIMKNWAIKAFPFFLLFWNASVSGELPGQQEPNESVSARAVLDYLAAGRADSALALSIALVGKAPDNPFWAYLHSLALYEHYDYGKSRDEALRSVADLPAIPGDLRTLLLRNAQYLDTCWTILSAFREVKGDHFTFCFIHPHDSILAGEVFDVLEGAREAMKQDLGVVPEENIRVEVYPTKGAFITVSTLTEDEVVRTGTIALSKFNRLLFISPRVVARGYGWKETLCHEYVHYVVTRLSRNRAPIWLHEGVAHFEEVRFRQPQGNTLSALEQDLLYRARRDNKMVSFARMSPSMAKLKDAEESGTAFAEVMMAMRFIVDRAGYEGVRAVLRGCAEGHPLDSLLSRVVLKNPALSFENAFFNYLADQPLSPVDGVSIVHPDLSEDDEKNETFRYRKYVRLSEMLLENHRVEAAVKELERADSSGRNRSPWVLNAVGQLYQKNGSPERAVEAYAKSIRLFPEYVTAYFYRGCYFAEQGKPAEAEADFLAALDINPFHLPVRRELVALYVKSGKKAQEKKERLILKILESGIKP
ncbi:MAG: hypothetical protein A2293_02590 [Elusimicrobia bacterium RIFOXYB2_FULL_49_7]|nr:MAG: hypothetical protein A2293_02590 [Elusimicrobia bacterium RIFOXYB2_FULL_49_7]